MPFNLKNLTGNILIVGEGGRDSDFLAALCAEHQLENNFQISSVEGNTTFHLLGKLSILPGYDTHPGILIFGDNDEAAKKSFKIIKEQLNSSELPSPSRPMLIARKRNHPPLAVAMMPFPEVDGSDIGCLETLLIPAISRKHPVQTACVGELYKCAKIDKWKTKSSRDKLLVRCILSSACEDNPMCGVNEWFKASSKLIPMDDQIFSRLVEFLSAVPSWFASGIDDWEAWKASLPRAQPAVAKKKPGE